MSSGIVIACEDEDGAGRISFSVDKIKHTQQTRNLDCVRVERHSQWRALVAKEQRAAYKIQPYGAHVETMRVKLCDWAYQFVDSVTLDRGIVSISFSYFDRYVYRQIEKKEFKIDLVFITSLYLAIKIHSFSGMTFPAFKISEITGGKYDEAQIMDMELSLLGVLGWQVNPPVPALFLSLCNDLCNDQPEASLNGVWTMAKFLIELSVYDVFFARANPSSIALAAVSVAANIHSVPVEIIPDILDFEVTSQSDQKEMCTERLQAIYNQWRFSTNADSRPVCHSPTIVSRAGESAKRQQARRRLHHVFQAEDTVSHLVTDRMNKKRTPSTV